MERINETGASTMVTSSGHYADEQARQALVQLWRECVYGSSERFGLSHELTSMSVVVDGERPIDWPEAWDTQVAIDGNTVHLPFIVGTEAPLVRALLNREALRLMLSSDSVDAVVVSDIACAFGEQCLGGPLLEEWRQRWRASSKQVPSPTGAVYDGPEIFRQLHAMGEEEYIDGVVGMVIRFARAGVRLSVHEWVRLLADYMRGYVIRLNTSEVRVLGAVLASNGTVRERIAQETGMSTNWVGRLLQRLIARGQLRVFERLSLRALSVQVRHLLITPTEGSTVSASDLVAKCPFLYSSREIVSGGGGLMATLAIPDNKDNSHAVDRAIAHAESEGVSVQAMTRERVKTHYSFHHYVPGIGGWSIDWTVLYLRTAHLVEDGRAQPSLLDLPDPPTPLRYIDSIGTRVLCEFQGGATTVRELRQTIGCRTETICKWLNVFRESGVIGHVYELHHAGLSEDILVVCRHGDEAYGLAALAEDLPMTHVEQVSEDRLMFRIRVPDGETAGLARTVRGLCPTAQVHLLGGALYGRWKLSTFIEDWNSYHGRWDAYRGVDEWLDSVEGTGYQGIIDV